MSRSYGPLSDEHKAKIREGMVLTAACKLARELPHCTPEQLLLRLRPDYDNATLDRLAPLLEQKIAMVGRYAERERWDEDDGPVYYKRGTGSRGRRVIRKGDEMS